MSEPASDNNSQPDLERSLEPSSDQTAVAFEMVVASEDTTASVESTNQLLTSTVSPLTSTLATVSMSTTVQTSPVLPLTSTVSPLTSTIPPLTSTISPLTSTIATAPMSSTVQTLTSTIATAQPATKSITSRPDLLSTQTAPSVLSHAVLPLTSTMSPLTSTLTTAHAAMASVAPSIRTVTVHTKDTALPMTNRPNLYVTLTTNKSSSVSRAIISSSDINPDNLSQKQSEKFFLRKTIIPTKENTVATTKSTNTFNYISTSVSRGTPSSDTNPINLSQNQSKELTRRETPSSIATSRYNPVCTANKTTAAASTNVVAATKHPASDRQENSNEANVKIIIPTVEELMQDRRNLVCTVTGCGKVFAGPPALRMHLNKTHKIYESPDERDIFTNTRGLATHAIIKQYYCPIDNCRRSIAGKSPFPKLSLLKQHYVGIHAEKTFTCSRCPAKFGMEKLRTRHESTCGVMFQCTCTAEYKTRGALFSHAKYQNHPLPANFALRPLRQHQKVIRKQQEHLEKQQQKLQRQQEKQLVKQVLKQMEEQQHQIAKQLRVVPAPILPKLPPNLPFCPPPFPHQPFPVALGIVKPARTVATQTPAPAPRRKKGPSKKTIKLPSKSLFNEKHHLVTSLPQHVQSLQQTQSMVQSQGLSRQYGEMMQYHQNMETQTSLGVSQSTHTFTQTQGDVIVRDALLSANIETQTSCAPQLVQSSTQYSHNYATSTETQTAHRNTSLSDPNNSLFDFDSMSVDNQERVVVSHPAAQTQTSVATLSSSDAQTDNWMSALYGGHSSPVPTHSPGGSLMVQPSDVPTQTDLSFLDDMFGLSHSETQTMKSLASFMTESSSTQTSQGTPATPNTHQQSIEVQTHMTDFASPTSYNISHGTSTQTRMSNLPIPVSTSTTPSTQQQSIEVQTHMADFASRSPYNISHGTSSQTHMSNLPMSLSTSTTPGTQQQSIEVQTHMKDFASPSSYNISHGTSTQTHMSNLPMSLSTSTTPGTQQQSIEVQTHMKDFASPSSYNILHGTSTQTHMSNLPMSLSTSTTPSIQQQSIEIQTHMADFLSPPSYNTSQGTSTQTHKGSLPLSLNTSTCTNTLQSTEAQTHMRGLSRTLSFNISQGTSTETLSSEGMPSLDIATGISNLQSTEVQTHVGDLSNPTPYNISQGRGTLQSTEAQTHMAGLIGPMTLNTSQTQTSFADLCLGGVLLPEQHPFRLDDGLSSSHQQTQTGECTDHQSTQTAAEKELDAALSLLNRYTQTGQSESNNNASQRPSDSLTDLEFTSMHTQTMEDVLAVLDNDNHSASVQTDFEAFSGDGRSFSVSTVDRGSPNNSGVAVQTDTLDLSSLQDLDFYTNSSSSSQTS